MTAPKGASCRDRPRVLLAALIRHVPLRLLDVSPDGCLFASPALIDVGTVGRLDVMLRDGHRVHAVRVCRSVRRKGRSWPYQVAAQLLILGAPAPASGRPFGIQRRPGVETTRRRSKEGLHG